MVSVGLRSVRAAAHVSIFARPSEQENKMHPSESSLARTLLIVDDSKVSRMRIRAFFAAHCPQWTIHEAESGGEALLIAAKNTPDFVTMDVNMPGMSGIETAQMMLMRSPAVRIVMLTANIQESSRKVAASLHLNFVAKPATETSLQQALDFLLTPA
jgi:two-component system chemotaxis response regulator CheY